MSRQFGWDYPPGVTGGEFEIAGPDYEKEIDDRVCPTCGSPLMEQGYREERWEICSDGHEFGLEPIGPDPDRRRDEARDRELEEEWR